MPVEVRHAHLLTRAVVDAAEDVHAVIEVVCAVKEPGEGHWGELHELERLQVQNHGVLRSRAVVVATQDHNLVARNENSSLSLDGKGELDEQDSPAVVCDVVLLNRVDAAVPFVAAKDIEVAVLEDDSGHGASLLVEFCNALPPIQVDRVAFAAFQHAVDRAPAYSVHVVALVGQSVRVAALEQLALLLRRLVYCVVDENLAADVGERRVEPSGDEDAPVVQSNGHRIALQHQVLWHVLLRPVVFPKVVLQNHLRVVRVAEVKQLRYGLHLVVEELERVLVRELHDIVLQSANVFE